MLQLANFIILFLWSVAAFALTVDVPLKDSVQESRARELFTEIRCMVCQRKTIADSHAEVASDMRRNIREQIAAGVSEDKIKSDLAMRYGNVILMSPPLKNNTALLWFGPWLVLFLGATAMHFYFRGAKLQKKL